MLDEQQLKILSQVAQGAQNVQICLGDGIQNNYYNTSAPASAAKPPIQEAEVVAAATTATERTAATAADGAIATEELFRFTHPRLDVKEEEEIDRQIRKLVKHSNIPTICKYLRELSKQNDILLPDAQPMFEELHRLGMPGKDKRGYTYDNFVTYYKK